MKTNPDRVGQEPMYEVGAGKLQNNITPRCFVVTILFASSLAFSFGVSFRRMISLNATLESLENSSLPASLPTGNIDVSSFTTSQVMLSKSSLVHKVPLSEVCQANNSFNDRPALEALVHPAMITHPNPERVGIIGGRDCSVLFEVLKHKSVKQATVVDLGDSLAKRCTQCTDSWFDLQHGPVPVVLFEEGPKWFNFDRGENEQEKFDVIIMNQHVDAESIYSGLNQDSRLESSLQRMLSQEGVFVVQLEADEEEDVTMLHALHNSDAGFSSIHIYEEGNANFLVSLKDYSSRASWFRTSAEVDVELHRRLRRNQMSELFFFDAPTMISYQVPSKAQENAYCTQEDTPEECKENLGFDPDWVNIPLSHLEAKKSTVGEFAGRGLFAAHDISAGARFDMNLAVNSFHVLPSTWSAIEDLKFWAEGAEEYPFVYDKVSSMVTFIDGQWNPAVMF
ncbi:hypothetical protein ACHAWF_007694 [Thalassiosira exigua]